MKYSEIKDLSIKELVEKLEETKVTLTRMKLNHAISPLENPKKITETRRDIAKINTELRRREIETVAQGETK